MGKYSDVIRQKNISRLEPEDKDYQEKVDKLKTLSVAEVEARVMEMFAKCAIVPEKNAKKKLANLNEHDLGYLYAKYKAIKDSLDSKTHGLLYAVNMMIEALDQIFVDTFDEKKIDKLRFDDLGTFSKKDGVYVKIADPEKFDAWAEEQGLDYKMRNYPRIAGDVREMLYNGEELPPGIEIKAEVGVHFTKAK